MLKNDFDTVFRRSIDEPAAFWAQAAEGIDWQTVPTRVLDESDLVHPAWFADGRLNTCDNALDRHVKAGRGAQPALIHDSAYTGEKTVYSYDRLLDETARFAGVLRGLGVAKGDRVLIYMPMIPEAVVAMLACARLGAVHSVVFGGFAAPELATRITDAAPRVAITASCGIEPGRTLAYKPLLDAAIDLSPAAVRPAHCVIKQRPQLRAELREDRDYDWDEVMVGALAVDCVSLASGDPLYILYTSGTTGVPKGVVRDSGGHAVALHWSMRHVYGVEPGEVFWAASDIGWVVGHSYIVYGPLLLGCTTVMYEGKPVGTPDAGAFWRVAAEHGVDVMFTAPTALRAIKQHDPQTELLRQHAPGMRALFLAGERADPDTLDWASRALGRPVIDHWWQTESGWPMAANCLGIQALPVKLGSPARPVPGYDIRVLDPDDSSECEPGESGHIVVKLPLPPGNLPTLWRNDERFVDTYLSRYPGYYETGDAGYLDEDGYLWVMSRTDDIINVAGHRLSTGGMEEILAAHPAVAECAVIGVADRLKGQVPLGLVVLKAGAECDPVHLEAELVGRVRGTLGPVAALKHVHVVPRLPKTRSGKILRKTMRKMAAGESFKLPPTIDDPAVMDELRPFLAPA